MQALVTQSSLMIDEHFIVEQVVPRRWCVLVEAPATSEVGMVCAQQMSFVVRSHLVEVLEPVQANSTENTENSDGVCVMRAVPGFTNVEL